MEALTHNDIHDFAATAGAFLTADPVNHSVHLTSMDAALAGRRQPATLISLHENGTVVGAVTRMEGRPLHAAAMPPAAAPLVVDTLATAPASRDHRPAGPLARWPAGPLDRWPAGPLARVEPIRKLWRDGGRGTYRLRLYRLEDLVLPDVPGKARPATPPDDDLITDWWIAFVAELDGLPRAEAEQRALDGRWMSAGPTCSGRSTAYRCPGPASTTPVGRVSRVGTVYTLSERSSPCRIPPRFRICGRKKTLFQDIHHPIGCGQVAAPLPGPPNETNQRTNQDSRHPIR